MLDNALAIIPLICNFFFFIYISIHLLIFERNDARIHIQWQSSTSGGVAAAVAVFF